MLQKIIALIFLGLAPLCFAQTQAKGTQQTSKVGMDKEQEKEIVRSTLVGSLQRTLSKYLQAHQFSVQVNFELAEGEAASPDIPYAPASIVADTFVASGEATILKRVKNLQVTLLLPDYIDKQSQNTLAEIVRNTLSLDGKSQVTVDVRSIKLNVQEPSRASPSAPAQMMMAPGGAASGVQDAALKAALEQVQSLKSDLERLKQEKIASPLEAVNGTRSDKPSIWQESLDFAKAHPVVVAIALALSYIGLFALLLVPARLLAGAMKGFGDAFGAIAKSVKGLAESFAQRAPEATVRESPLEQRAEQAKDVAATEGGRAFAAAREVDPARVKERIAHLRSSYTVDADNLAFEFVCSLLKEPESRRKVPIFLELLDEFSGRRIFQRLSEEQKQEVLNVLRSPKGGDKGAVILELIDSFETKLAGKDWKGLTDTHLSRELQNQISILKDEELTHLAHDLSETGLRRLLLYLRPATIVALLQSVKGSQGHEPLPMIEQIASMPEALMDHDADQEIMQKAKSLVSAKNSDAYHIYLANFVEIIEGAGEGVDDNLIEALSAARPEFGSQLRKSIMTIGGFFRLPESLQSEALQGFSNYELAALISAFPDHERRQVIYKTLDKRRRELIEESVEMLQNEQAGNLQEIQRKVKQKLLESLRTMARAGAMADASLEESGDPGASLTTAA